MNICANNFFTCSLNMLRLLYYVYSIKGVFPGPNYLIILRLFVIVQLRFTPNSYYQRECLHDGRLTCHGDMMNIAIEVGSDCIIMRNASRPRRRIKQSECAAIQQLQSVWPTENVGQNLKCCHAFPTGFQAITIPCSSLLHLQWVVFRLCCWHSVKQWFVR